MKKQFPLAVFISFIFFCSCNSNTNKTEEETKEDTAITSTPTDTSVHEMRVDTATKPLMAHAEAKLSGTYSDTTVDGTAVFDSVAGNKVKMVLTLTISKKAGKSVAVHIHEHGDCGDTGKLAHGHWNPGNTQHGKWGSANFHAGDIGNVKLNSAGKGTLTLTTNLWSIGGTADKNIVGRSIIVHGGMDDYKTQPSGNSGGRIGCGVIKE